MSSRDPRLDVLRGLALLVLLVNHGEELSQTQVLSLVTYAPIGVSTAAELFIFLSGLVLGIAYWPVLASHGYVRMHTRCLARAWQIYLLHIASLVFTVVAVVGLTAHFGTTLSGVFASQGLVVSSDSLARFLQLEGNPQYFDILPLYIVFLLYVPFLLPLLRRHTAWGLGISTGLYLLAQFAKYSGQTAVLPFSGALYYNPMAWQLLFVIGVTVGFRMREGQPLPRISGRGVLVAAGLLIVAAAWYKGVRLNAVTGWFAEVRYVPGQPVPFDVPLTDKSTLGPVRLVHFLLLAALAARWLPSQDSRVWRSRVAGALAVCGRHGLEVFVAGVVLTYVIGTVMRVSGGGDPVMMLALDLTGILALLAWAELVDWRRREPWRLRAVSHGPDAFASGDTVPTARPVAVAGVSHIPRPAATLSAPGPSPRVLSP